MILIDGYNLIKSPVASFPHGQNLEAQREHLLRLLHSSPLARNCKIIVVFDGSDTGGTGRHVSYRGIRVIFSGLRKSADDVIREMIRSDADPATLQVVTSDREIQFTARDLGAQVVESPRFWNRLHSQPTAGGTSENDAARPNGEISDREVREWLELFRNRKDHDDED